MSDERITLCELEWTLVWNVRGDPAQSAFAVEAERLLGVALPLEPNTTAHRAGAAALWSARGHGSSLREPRRCAMISTRRARR